MVLVSDKPSTILVFYRLNSAIERGTKPDAVGWKPCHWTSTLKAAIVNARRAGKYAQPRADKNFKGHFCDTMLSTAGFLPIFRSIFCLYTEHLSSIMEGNFWHFPPLPTLRGGSY